MRASLRIDSVKPLAGMTFPLLYSLSYFQMESKACICSKRLKREKSDFAVDSMSRLLLSFKLRFSIKCLARSWKEVEKWGASVLCFSIIDKALKIFTIFRSQASSSKSAVVPNFFNRISA